MILSKSFTHLSQLLRFHSVEKKEACRETAPPFFYCCKEYSFNYLNPAKRKAMAVKNEKRFLSQKRNVLQKSLLFPFRLDYPVKIQASFKRFLKAV